MPIEGNTFADIASAPSTDGLEAEPTTEPKVEAVPPATEGGEPEPETPAFLKETTQEEDKAQEGEDEKPDLKLPESIAKLTDANPELKAEIAKFVEAKEKGIDKFIQNKNTEIQTLKQQVEDSAPVLNWFSKFDSPDTVDEAFKEACAGLAKTHGRPFGGYDAQGNQVEASTTQREEPADDDEPKSKYGLEFASDDKIADFILGTLKGELKEIKEAINPINERFKKTEQTEAEKIKEQQANDALKAKVDESIPELRSQLEVAADPSLVTEDRVTAALKKFPDLPPMGAFGAMYWKEIAAYTAKYSGSNKPKVREMPQGGSGGKSHGDLKPGASFGDIASAEATL